MFKENMFFVWMAGRLDDYQRAFVSWTSKGRLSQKGNRPAGIDEPCFNGGKGPNEPGDFVPRHHIERGRQGVRQGRAGRGDRDRMELSGMPPSRGENCNGVFKHHALSPATTTLLLIGHGFTHDPASETTVALQAERIRASSNFRSVMTAFIDQPLFLRDVLASVHQPLIGMALFGARGNHVVEDVEKQFSRKHNRNTALLGAVGEDKGLTDIIGIIESSEYHIKIKKLMSMVDASAFEYKSLTLA